MTFLSHHLPKNWGKKVKPTTERATSDTLHMISCDGSSSIILILTFFIQQFIQPFLSGQRGTTVLPNWYFENIIILSYSQNHLTPNVGHPSYPPPPPPPELLQVGFHVMSFKPLAPIQFLVYVSLKTSLHHAQSRSCPHDTVTGV